MIDPVTWAKGVLSIEFLGKECQGLWVPILSKKDKNDAIKILMDSGLDSFLGIELKIQATSPKRVTRKNQKPNLDLFD